MGIDARIEDEDAGQEKLLLDAGGLTARLLAGASGPGSCCLRFIDPCGDTLFNQLQLPVLLEELRSLVATTTDAELVARGEVLLRFLEGAEHIHTYVRFVGD